MLWNTIAVNEKPDKSNIREVGLIDSENYITEEDVKFVAESSLGSNIQVIDYHAKIFADIKLGFFGVHRYLNVTIQKSDSAETEVHSYFLKAIPRHNESQASFIADGKMFYKEANFYRHLVPELLKNSKDKSFIARCYLLKEDALVLENLALKNFRPRGIFLDAVSLKLALSSLAKLHAASILTENRLGKSLIDLYPDIFEERLFAKSGKSFEWFVSSVNVLIAVAKSLGLNDQYVPRICDRIFELVSPSKTRQNVVCHGAAKSSNLMFDDSQPMPNCALVDFQMVRYMPPMADIAQLVYLNCTRELRENLEEDLLKHYYEIFSNILQEENLKEKIPSYSNILREYQELQLTGLIMNALFAPMRHIDGKKCTEFTSDSDGFSKFIFQNRDELILKIMQEDANYKGILKEVISEINERAAHFL